MYRWASSCLPASYAIQPTPRVNSAVALNSDRPIGESAAEKRGHLAAKVRHREGERCPAAAGVIDRLKVVPHRPDPINVPQANPAGAAGPLHCVVERSY